MIKGFHQHKKKKVEAEEVVEINVTPMIDMFSVLNSFLLMTAVFSASGYFMVEVPFLSSKPPEKQEVLDKKPQLNVNVTLDTTFLNMEIGKTNNTKNIIKEKYDLTEQGLDSLQAKLYELRKNDPRFDKVTVFCEKDVKYEKLIMLIESMRVLKNNRPPLPLPLEYKLPFGVGKEDLIPKIVLGDAVL